MKFGTLGSACLGLLALVFMTACSSEEERKESSSQAVNQAGVVVRLDEKTVESRCVEFQAESISGLELITMSGLNVDIRVEGLGSAVCSIEGSGCSADDCFCRCSLGGDCVYWSYWHQEDDGWRYAVSGANSYKINHGDVDGWSWGPGSASQAIEPPIIPFEDICGSEAVSSRYDLQSLNNSGPTPNLVMLSSELMAANLLTSVGGRDR